MHFFFSVLFRDIYEYYDPFIFIGITAGILGSYSFITYFFSCLFVEIYRKLKSKNAIFSKAYAVALPIFLFAILLAIFSMLPHGGGQRNIIAVDTATYQSCVNGQITLYLRNEVLPIKLCQRTLHSLVETN